ncbi:dimethylaniline monooxygenase [N-oxide-forming] [Elysia marginata]|uniref:Flavin-containing monooxygenase n=1 Tax=Elysia marginata TaxID=1093978 RepID=A0AAV4HQX2_9GAST|nr:dimethylaniline monooxygenase [N-oxide-forming] [Elysia marginata]
MVFPPDLERGTLAVIGCFMPEGSLMPMAEMQCRVATRVFQGYLHLPDSSSMWRDVNQRDACCPSQPMPSQRYAVALGQISYMDQLAELIGCRPDFGTV